MMNSFLAVVWNVDPTFFHIGSLEIRYYGVLWALAILAGSMFFYQFCKREGLPSKIADSIFIYGALATIIGARLGHCFFYEPAYYIAHPLQILNVRDGGLASHGAAIGLLIGLWMFSKRNKMPYLWSLDRVMVPVAVGGAMVRLGNLLNSEIYGVETDLPWGFIFVRAGETMPKHPTQIYEALCYLLLFGILCWLYYRKDQGRRHPGLMFGVGLIGIFLSRFIIEFIKNPQVGFELNMNLLMGQWLSVPFIILGVVMIVYGLRHKQNPVPLEQIKAEYEKKARAAANNEQPAGKKKSAPSKNGKK